MPAGDGFEICEWKGGKKAALSITLDDCWKESVARVLPILRKNKTPATFSVIGGLLGKEFEGRVCIGKSELAVLRAAGHEIASHGLTHRRLDLLPMPELAQEISGSQQILRAVSFVYPYSIENRRIRRLVKRHYLCARTGLGRINAKRPRDFCRLSSFASMNSSSREMNSWLENLGSGWMIETHHLVGRDRNYKFVTAPKELGMHLGFLRKQDIWLDTIGNVAKYIIERDNSRIKVLEDNLRTITLGIKSRLDPRIFNIPLTVRFGGNLYEMHLGEKQAICRKGGHAQ